jgi:hypothetical protein
MPEHAQVLVPTYSYQIQADRSSAHYQCPDFAPELSILRSPSFACMVPALAVALTVKVGGAAVLSTMGFGIR